MAECCTASSLRVQQTCWAGIWKNGVNNGVGQQFLMAAYRRDINQGTGCNHTRPLVPAVLGDTAVKLTGPPTSAPEGLTVLLTFKFSFSHWATCPQKSQSIRC